MVGQRSFEPFLPIHPIRDHVFSRPLAVSNITAAAPQEPAI